MRKFYSEEVNGTEPEKHCNIDSEIRKSTLIVGLMKILFGIFMLTMLGFKAEAQTITFEGCYGMNFTTPGPTWDLTVSSVDGTGRNVFYDVLDDQSVVGPATLKWNNNRWELSIIAGLDEYLLCYSEVATSPNPPTIASGNWQRASGWICEDGDPILLSGDLMDAGGTSTTPTVTTTAATAITATSAMLGGNVTADGGATVEERGIVWATTTNPTTADNKVPIDEGTGTFSQTVSDLPSSTTIYYRAYAINSEGTAYGNNESFTTLAGGVLLNSNPTLTFTNNTGLEDFVANDGEGGSTAISDIDIEIYEISDVAGARQNTILWKDNDFLASNDPNYSGLTTEINPASPLTDQSGSKGTSIKSSDGSEFKLISFRYYNWGESESFTNTIKGYRDGIEVASTTFQGFDEAYDPIIVTLPATFSNVDEVRMYISAGGYVGDQTLTNHSINEVKLGSPEISPNVAPTVTTSTPATAITATSATLGGNVTADGGATVTDRGIVYNTSGTPTIADTKVQIGDGTGVFSDEITGLTAETIYYVRAYAINSEGTAYGEEVSFTTTATIPVSIYEKLYWHNYDIATIESMHLDGQNRVSLLSNEQTDEVYAIGIDPIGEKLYWNHANNEETYRSNLDGSSIETIINNTGDATSMFVDPIGGKIYWNNYSAGKIERANLDGTNRETVIDESANGGEPFSLTLDISGGKIYWFDASLGIIKRAGINGQDIEEFASEVEYPYTLYFDHETRFVYWDNYGDESGKIERKHADNGSRQTVIDNCWPVSLTIDKKEGKIYWLNQDENNVLIIMRANLNDGTSREVFAETPGFPYALIIPYDYSTIPVNTPPTATSLGQTISFTEGEASVAIDDIVVTDPDVGETITATLTISAPTAGTLTTGTYGDATSTFNSTTGIWAVSGSVAGVNDNLAAVAFTPAADWDQGFTITTHVEDAAETGPEDGTITVTVTPVNDAPVITAPATINVNEDVAAALTGISFADVDAGSGNVTATLAVPGGLLSATSGGAVTVGGTGSALTLTGAIADLNAFIAASNVTYTTAQNATDDVTLTVTINDGGNTGTGGAGEDAATITLEVAAVNDAPVNTVPGGQAVDQGGVLVFSAANSNAISVADTDAGEGIIQVTLTATNGLLTLSGTTGLTFSAGDGTDDGTMAFEGTVADINPALAGLEFAPAGGYNGPASLQIISDDNGLSGAGGTQTDTDEISITVNSISPTVNTTGSVSADGTYKIGDGVILTVTFDQTVTVDESGGSPALLLETGDTDREAVYDSGSGSNTLAFTYTVEAGDHSADLDYASTAALVLNGATIRNTAADDAVLTLPAVGGSNSIAGQHGIVIDGVAPAAPSRPLLYADDDTGTSGSDHITNVAAPRFTGTAEAGSTVRLYDTDGVTELGQAVATDGNWTITSKVLTEDTHTLTAIATDAAGNPGAASAERIVVIDITAPAKPAVPDLAPASDSGESDTDNITNLADLTLQGAAGSVEANTALHARSSLDGGLTGGTANADGSWSFDVSALGEGTHQLQINAADAAGNTSAYSDAVTVVIDATAPDGHGVSFDDDAINATEAASIGFSFSDAEAGAGYSYTITGSGGGTPVTGTGTLTATTDPISGIDVSGLPDGTLTLSVMVMDAAGNSAVAVTDAAILDRVVPEVDGVESGEYYKEDVTPAFDEGTALLNGNPYVSGTPITAEGGYKLTVTDAAGNMTVVTFTIDKTVPEVEGVESGEYYRDDVTPAFDEGTALLNGNPYVSGTPITAEGGYKLTVTDAAGNMTVVAFTIDKTVPEVDGVESGEYYNEDVTPAFDEGTALLNGNPYVSGTPITAEGGYKLTVTDAAGNMTVVAFTIDKTRPEITGVDDGASYNMDVTPAFNEGTATLNGEVFTSGTPVTEEGEYELLVTDASGNADTVRFTIDKTRPEITGVDDGASYNMDVTPAFNEGTAILNGEAFTSGTPVTEEGEYELFVTDASGNADTVRFTIDKTRPEITGVDDGASYNMDVTPAFNEGTAILNGEAFTSGTPVTEEGEYELFVTDASGNADTVRFTIDKTRPEITGVDDGASYNMDVTPAFNEGTAALNGETFTSGTVITDEGEYTLVVTDAAGNADTVSFIVDKTKPEITGVTDGASYNGNVTVNFNEGTATLNGEAFTPGTVITDEDEYTLVVTDAAGNADTVGFTIDRGLPGIAGATDGALYNKDVTVTFNEGTATLNGEPYTPGTVITEEDEYTLVVTDAAGNETVITFIIDRTAPVITGVEDGGLYAGEAAGSFNEGTATLNGAPYTSGTPITVPGGYTLTVTDAAGNVSTAGFTVGALPGAPSGLRATAGNRQVMLEWEAPAGVIPAVTDYVIGYSRDGGTTWTVPDREPSAATRSLVIGLENNRGYLFRVAAVNAVGTGAASGTVEAVPTEPVPDVEGNLPEPDPGVPVVVTDGRVEAVMLEVVDSEYLRLSGDGYAMELASVGPGGERIPISAVDAVIRLLKGNGTQVYVGGNGFEPGTVVTVYLFSTPELVGHLPVGPDGTYGGSLPVPANLELGHHTLQANGVVAGGSGERSVSVGLELVDRKPQWVAFGALADRTYGDGPVTLPATATSNLAVSYTVTDADGNATDIASIENDNELHIRGAGDIVLTAEQAGNADYSAATPVRRTLHISKAPLAVSVASITRAYGEDNPAFKVSYDDFVNSEDASSLDRVPLAATEATETSAPGSYAIGISGGESVNYAFTYHGATLTITKAGQAITFTAPAEVDRSAGSIQLDVSSSSGLPVTLSIDDPQVATVSGTTLNIHRLGTMRITATQAGDGNYEAAEPVTVTIVVTDRSSDFAVRIHPAVSPNGDGINEFLMVEGIKDFPENRVTVISRNGTLLWEASGYDNDGVVFRGISTGQQQLPAGTYFYIVEVKVNGKWEHRKGYFAIRY